MTKLFRSRNLIQSAVLQWQPGCPCVKVTAVAELDLVPPAYRQELLVRYWLKLFCLTYVILIVGFGGARYFLYVQTAEIEKQVSRFELSRKETNRKQFVLNELEQERTDLENQAQIKERLQGGVPAQQMFLIMERSLDKSTWFKRWVYQRAEQLSGIDMEPASKQFSLSVPTGNNKSRSQAGNLTAHMEISGQAISHTKLAILVHNLATQPEIEDVKVVKTSQGKSRSTEVLDFSLAIRLRD